MRGLPLIDELFLGRGFVREAAASAKLRAHHINRATQLLMSHALDGADESGGELGLLIDLVHGHLSAASFVSCRHFVLSNNIRRSITGLLSILARAAFSIFAYNTCKSVVFSIKRVI